MSTQEIRDRLRLAQMEPGDFQSHAQSDIAYLLALVDAIAEDNERKDEEIVTLREQVGLKLRSYRVSNVEMHGGEAYDREVMVSAIMRGARRDN